MKLGIAFPVIASLTLFGASFALAGCGNGGAVLALELTDAPPDLATLERVTVTLSAVEVHVVGKDGDASKIEEKSWRRITSTPGTFDLLSLQNDVTAPLGEIEVDGKITQIRLFIDPNGKNEVVLKTGETCKLDVASVDSTGIKINHPFKAIDAVDGQTTKVVVDFDVKESVDQTGGCAFTLKPVIKIKRITAG